MFQNPAFRSVTTMTLGTNQASVYIEAGILKNLRSLGTLYIYDTIITNIAPDFCWGASHYFRKFQYSRGIPRNVSIEMFLKTELYWNLTILGINRGTVSEFPLLAPSNFSNLHSIQHMELFSCGIEIILNHTFDSIGRTLKWLSLRANKIRRIALSQFGQFLIGDRFTLIIDQNPLICDCDFYLMESLTMMIGSFRNESFQKALQCVSDDDGDKIEQCVRVQGIRPKNGCFLMPSGVEFRCPKYELRFRNDSILVRTNISRQFMLLVMEFRPGSRFRRKCRDALWIQRDSYKCFILQDGRELVVNWHIDHFNFTFVNVMFVHSKRAFVSPLHWMTLHKTPVPREIQMWSCVLVAFSGALVAFSGALVGFLVAFLWKSRKSKHSTDDPKRDDEDPDYFYY